MKYDGDGNDLIAPDNHWVLLTREAAARLKEAADDAAGKGFRLKIYDAYRPQKAVDHFMRWVKDPADTRMKSFFYPGLEKKRTYSWSLQC